MRRVLTLATAAAIAIGAFAGEARAANADGPRGGAVTSLSVVPATGHAEVVIGVNGAVDVQDFLLHGPDRIVVDLTGAQLGMPSGLYDRVARGGITNIRFAQYREDVVRVVIDLDGPRDYSVVRGDHDVRVTVNGTSSRFTAWHSASDAATAPDAALDAPEPSTPRARPTLAPVSSQPRITVTYQDADIRDVLAAFAAFSGRTIVAGRTVTGKITAEIRDQPWDVALRAILTAQGLDATEDESGIITVDSYENIAIKQAAEPLTTQLVSINYARAAGLVPTIKLLLSHDCSGRGTGQAEPVAAGSVTFDKCVTRGSVAADTSTNTLVVTDVPSHIDDVVKYIRDLDVRTPQVSIKAKIILVNRTEIQDLGVSYDLGSQTQFFNKLVQRPNPATFQPIDLNGDGIPDAMGGGTPYDPNVNIIDLGGNALSAIANANQQVATPALQLIFSTALGKFDLTTFLNALQEVDLADVQAEPSISTLDNRKANILDGQETPIRVIDASSGSGTGGTEFPRATVNFKQTGIILEVTPHITNNRQILMTLHAERSNLVAASSDIGFTFQKQSADNQLLVADGETAVIGGLTVTQVTVSKTGIPLLVDLPLIGRLFGRTFTQEDKRDLLILVTPHIVDEGERVGGRQGDR